ncbi:hypothetical protein ABPG75_012628 [Micractinium tetrahymenae]
MASAGPYKSAPGCYATDTVKSYPIKGASFVDFVKARKRGRDVAQAMYPTCTYIGHTPSTHDGGRISVPCEACLDTNRSNRPLAVPGRPGTPSFWGAPRVECA